MEEREMSMLRKRIERLEVIDGVGAERVIVVIGPEGAEAHDILAEHGVVARPNDLVVRINKPVGAETRVTVDGRGVG
jgi:hypothetical protein